MFYLQLMIPQHLPEHFLCPPVVDNIVNVPPSSSFHLAVVLEPWELNIFKHSITYIFIICRACGSNIMEKGKTNLHLKIQTMSFDVL